jgi:predicted DNA-binding protein
MTVMLELKPETESRVKSKAKSRGLTIENFLVEFIEEKINGNE